MRTITPALVFILLFASGRLSAQPEDIVRLSLPGDSVSAKAGGEFAVILQATVSPGWHINSNAPHDETLIPTGITARGKSVELLQVDYPKPEDITLEISDKPLSVFEGTNPFRLRFRTPEHAAGSKEEITITFSYQACNNQTCLAPADVTTRLAVRIEGAPAAQPAAPAAASGPGRPADSLRSALPPAPVPPARQSPTEGNDTIGSMLETSGMFLGLFLIFVAGLALNLTPCVYPLIPITIGYFGGQSEGSTGRLFLLGVLYMLGMAVTYSVVGVVTSLSGALFGALLQNTGVIIGIAVLFVVLALSQFGVYEFRLPNSWMAAAGGARSGAFGAFFMGLTMGIVAAPCIGPFVLGLVTYVAAKGDPYLGFLMFFTLALGLGFPYLFLALFSGKIKSLPRSGEWMEGVKHQFGLLLLGMALYFILPLLPKSAGSLALPIYGIVAALIFLVLDKKGNTVNGFRIFKIVFSVAALAVCVYALVPTAKRSPEWQGFSAAAYEESLRKGEPMIIDFYADWCIPCKELDAMTFSNPQVIDATKRFTAYKADLTKSGTKEVDELTARFGIRGVPTVLVVDSGGNEIERITGFLNAEEFLGRIQAVR